MRRARLFCVLLAAMLAGVWGARAAPADSAANVSAPAAVVPEKIEQGARRWVDRGAGQICVAEGYVPPERVAERIFETASYRLVLRAVAFAQGNAVYVEILPPAKAPPAPEFQAVLLFENQSVPLSKHAWGFRGFLGLGPQLAPGPKSLRVTAGVPPGVLSGPEHILAVARTKFPVYRSAMDLGNFSDAGREHTPEEKELIRSGQEKKARVFALRTATMIDRRLSHPRDLHRITSPFWAKRIVQRYRVKAGRRQNLKAASSVHGGLDLRAVTGAPVYALARGQVALAEPLFYEGNITMLDHGQGVLSVYMHQSELLVQKNTLVEAGQKIGLAGATGAVTGAHLHLAVTIRRVPVEPLSFLALPVRD